MQTSVAARLDLETVRAVHARIDRELNLLEQEIEVAKRLAEIHKRMQTEGI